MFEGESIDIPICGNETIGKLATHNIKRVTCVPCLENVNTLLLIENYSDIVISENSDKSRMFGSKETFWKNMLKIQR